MECPVSSTFLRACERTSKCGPLLVLAAVAACRGPASSVAPADAARIESEVAATLAAIPADLARGGPLAWLGHFDSDDFHMASEGEMKFASFAEARAAMQDFGPTIEEMELVWSETSVEALAPDVARFGTSYDEVLITTSGTELRFVGYVTGLMRRRGAGWRIARLHWSIQAPP